MSSVPNPSFDAGEAALQAGDYDRAIAQFNGVCETELDENLVTRAQQALIVAYCRCGRAEDAIALCHDLVQISTGKTWATKALEDLIQRYPEANTRSLIAKKAAPKTRRRKPPLEKRPIRPDTPNIAQSLVPSADTAPQEAAPTVFVPGRLWRNADRATKWKRLKAPKLWKLWALQILSAIALFWVVRLSLEGFMLGVNTLLESLPFLQPIPFFYRSLGYSPIWVLILCAIASPWILDLLLKQCYGVQPFSIPKLAAQFPEASKVVQKMTRQKKMPFPKLRLLPTNAPICFVYGNLPRTARLVLSEGLLEQLEDEELAVLIATQIAQIIHRDFIWMSGAMTFLQLPFTLYWYIANWGEKLRARSPQKPSWAFLSPLFYETSTILASLLYAAYWLWRLPLLWFSRQRLYYSDRLAAEYMGNPNALSRALLKTAIGMASEIHQQHRTSALLEGFDLLMPVGHRQALSLGSMPHKTPFSEVLTWECTNPYRHWLALANSHPLIGDRVYLLNRYANYWGLPPEIDLPTIVPPARSLKEKTIKLKNSYQALPILQSAFLSALFFGLLFRGIFWLAGILNDLVVSRWVGGSGVIWMYNANNIAIAQSCILFAFSLSIIVWINGYFPNIRISQKRNEPRLQDLLSDPKAVPPKSFGIRLTGKLIGRERIRNGVLQDLMLQTETGTIKLHFFTKLGPFCNLFWGLQTPLFWIRRWFRWRQLETFLDRYIPLYPRPDELCDREVTVTGWFRRGSTPWIDVDTLSTADKQIVRSGYPVWVTGLAIVAAIWGAVLMWRA
ncbi:M48 family metalloprotease [Lusitaniella coriacea LEGE 07157]|uniref:M48 family metalloprotease n=1 Tax=Lusitaniella coriacea LEGE 07157 TaxID=945747 RepID=A0A8J7DV23_9CYAN|nr:M48 family metalloprotease [Lusitaniella coriacea]MBE9115520.1 M48 family metalloprotease [Lusitaniella coriacea LEGE 07157]